MIEVARHYRVEKWRRVFLISAGVILAVVGVAKIISASGTSDILAYNDPIVGLPFRATFVGVGILELLIATMCFTGWRAQLSVWAIAWLAANFAVYRVGLWFIGWNRPCGCLGNLTDALHISPSAADWIAGALLCYLILGSSLLLSVGCRLDSNSHGARKL